MNAGTIAAVTSKFMDFSKDLPKETMEYLKTRTQASYDKLELLLKASGFTVKAYFDSLAENAPDQTYVDSFRNVSALSTEIEIIKNSNQLTDIEKIDRLDLVFKKQQEQQKEAMKDRRQKRKDYVKSAVAIGVMTVGGTLIIVNKNVVPALVKASGQIVKRIGKK